MSSTINKVRIGFLQTGVRNDIDVYKQHIDGIEAHLAKEVNDLVDYDRKLTEGFSEEEKYEYYTLYSDDYWHLNEVLPHIQRHSELVGIYTLLEHNLTLLCSIYEKHIDTKIKLSDIKARGIIDTAKKYLDKEIGLTFPSNSSSWSEIKTIQKIRNALVHNNGKLKDIGKNSEAIRKYISRTTLLELDQFKRIIIKRGFSERCLEVIRDFFEELFKAVHEHENTLQHS